MVLGVILLGFSAYSLGYHLNNDLTPTTATKVPLIRFTILSSRFGGCRMIVRDDKTGVTAEIESLNCYDLPEFEDGESVDMELWQNNSSEGRPDFVYRGDSNHKENTYHECGWSSNKIGSKYGMGD